MQQGTEFDTLAETVLADRYEQLVQLVTMIGDKGELPIAMALASVVVTPQMVNISVTCLIIAYIWVVRSFFLCEVMFNLYIFHLV